VAGGELHCRFYQGKNRNSAWTSPRLAKALPALYPKDSEEKKFLDAMLLGMLRG
jgi:hypothetical protein